jgi:hypothetical protein
MLSFNIFKVLKSRTHTHKLKNYLKISFLLYLSNFTFYFNIFAGVEEILEKEWAKNFGGSGNDYYRSGKRTSDGGYVVVGYTDSTDMNYANAGGKDAFIIKYDKDFNQEWIRFLSGDNNDFFYSVVETYDNGFVAVGDTDSTNIGFNNTRFNYIHAVKYDKNGNTVWQTYLDGNSGEVPYDLIETKDRGFAVVGRMQSTNIIQNNGDCDAFLAKFDSDGNYLWIANIGDTGLDDFKSVTEDENGNIICAGYLIEEGLKRSSVIAKFDNSGALLWQKSVTISTSNLSIEAVQDVITTLDGNIIVVGTTATKGVQQSFIAKYDKAGNQLWIKFTDTAQGAAYSTVLELSNKEVIAGGWIYTSGYRNIFLVKYDSFGEEVWRYEIDSSKNDYVTAICQSLDGNLIIFGYGYSNDLGFVHNGELDAIMIKLKVSQILTPDSTSIIQSVLFTPENILEVSLDSNQIVFDTFSYIQDTEKLNATKLTVSSTLAYNITVSLEQDIVGLNSGQKVDNSIFHIKSSSSSTYQNFSDDVKKLSLISENIAGDKIEHGIDMKIKGNKINKFDTYKAVLKFEVEQI